MSPVVIECLFTSLLPTFCSWAPGTWCPGTWEVLRSVNGFHPRVFAQAVLLQGLCPLCLARLSLETPLLQAFAALSLGRSPPCLPWPPAPLATELPHLRVFPREQEGDACSCFRNQKQRHLAEVFLKKLILLNPSKL